MCWNVISEAKLGVRAAKVLILNPFWVRVKVQFVTLTHRTSFSAGYFPKLPMLIPWPGPQVTPVMFIFVVPGPKETQSSPVAMCVLVIVMAFEFPMWTPSVLGLLPGAVMWTLSMLTVSQFTTPMWNFLLLIELMPSIEALFTNWSFNDC